LRYIDPSTIRKNSIIENITKEYSTNIPIFSIIEFNIYGTCNRNCHFCPVSNSDIYTKKHEGISIDLFNKALDDLVEIDFKGKILFSAFCEPLLHKDLEILIKNGKEKLPNARFEIVSNGDILTNEKLKKIFEAGLDTISISMYDGEYQVEKFNKMAKECDLDDSQLILRRRYLQDGNYGMTISNRSGVVDSNKYRDEKEEKVVQLPLKNPCYYPFYQILIDYNGDVLLCPHDWSRKLSFGNIKSEKIVDLWNSEKLKSLRYKLSNSDRGFFPCDGCDVMGTLMGKDNFNQWNEFYKKES
jgi:radical SAM protein with 4Fe4S-binding SPASM domain